MEEERTLLLGIDLNGENAQVSAYNDRTGQPEQVAMPEPDNSRLPFVTARRGTDGEWLYGTEAAECLANGLGEGTDGFCLLSPAEEVPAVRLLGEEFSAEELLGRFFHRLLIQVRAAYPEQRILCAVVCLPAYSQALAERVQRAFVQAGLAEEHLICASRSQCFAEYAFRQKKDLWKANIGLFDCGRDGLNWLLITVNRKRRPAIAEVTSADYGQIVPEAERGSEACRTAFGRAAVSALDGQNVTTLYAAGSRFEEEWGEPALAALCRGRRVFAGQNIYVWGACCRAYALAAAAEKAAAAEEGGSAGGSAVTAAGGFSAEGHAALINGILVLTEETTTADLTVRVWRRDRYENLVLCRAGSSCYENSTELDLIPENNGEIRFISDDEVTGEHREYLLSCAGLPKRPPKMTRLHVCVRADGRSRFEITAEDKGFGSFCKGTGRILNAEEAAPRAEAEKEPEEKVILCVGTCMEQALEADGGRLLLYSQEELAYFVYQSIYVLDPVIFAEPLYVWLEQAGSRRAAERLRRSDERGEPVDEKVSILLRCTNYYTDSEAKDSVALMRQMADMTPIQKLKMKGDNYMKQGRYEEAAREYDQLLRGEYASQLRLVEYGNIKHNLAVAHLYTADFRQAAEEFQEAWQNNHDPASKAAAEEAALLANGEMPGEVPAVPAGDSRDEDGPDGSSSAGNAGKPQAPAVPAPAEAAENPYASMSLEEMAQILESWKKR